MPNFLSYGDILGRHRLIDLLPLNFPLSMIIDPCNMCNFKCVFCPTGHSELIEKVKRPKGKMSIELFKKIINDIKSMLLSQNNRIKRLFLDKDGEPLMNEDFFDMVKYAKSKEVFLSVETTTNFSLLDKSTIFKIVESGLDIIRISIEHISNDNYRTITGTKYNYDQIKKNVENLFKEKERRGCGLKIHIKSVGLESEEQKNIFIRDFTDISDTIHIETLVGWSHTDLADFTLGREITTGMDSKSKMKYDRMICNLPFRTMSINWNGQTSICCVDWTWNTIIGDVSKESLHDIWNGQRMYNFRKMHASGKKNDNPACKTCHYLYGLNELDELDGHKNKLSEIYGFNLI